jgi:hypothetical protein
MELIEEEGRWKEAWSFGSPHKIRNINEENKNNNKTNSVAFSPQANYTD